MINATNAATALPRPEVIVMIETVAAHPMDVKDRQYSLAFDPTLADFPSQSSTPFRYKNERRGPR